MKKSTETVCPRWLRRKLVQVCDVDRRGCGTMYLATVRWATPIPSLSNSYSFPDVVHRLSKAIKVWPAAQTVNNVVAGRGIKMIFQLHLVLGMVVWVRLWYEHSNSLVERARGDLSTRAVTRTRIRTLRCRRHTSHTIRTAPHVLCPIRN